MTEIELFNNYKCLFDVFQRYFEALKPQTQFVVESYKQYRRDFLNYKPIYEKKTSDYRKNSSYICIGKKSYEFIIPQKFIELMRKTNISDTERKIINESYIGSTFSWNLNTKLRNAETLKEEELLIKKTLQKVINKNIISENIFVKNIYIMIILKKFLEYVHQK